MNQYTLTMDEVASVMAQLSDATKQQRKIYYDSGVLYVPDEYKSEVDAAVANISAGTSARLRAYAAAKRFEKEGAGTTVNVSGSKWVLAATDRESQSMLTSAFVLAQSNQNFSADWKQTDGSFVELNAAEMMTLAQAVAVYVGTCFALESQCVDGITGATITTNDQIDAVLASWP
jgi:hypothetical protein